MADLFTSILASILGLLAGAVASILGIGGGALFVPILYLIFGLSMYQATATSLLVIFTLSSTAAFFYSRSRRVLWKLALIFEAGSIPGSIAGGYVCHMVSSELLALFFSLLLFYISYRMWIGGSKARIESASPPLSLNLGNPKTAASLLIVGFLAGFLSNLLGVGGGIVKVPAMTLIFGVSMHNAVATSMAMIVLTSLTGVLTRLSFADIDFGLGLVLIPSAVLGSYLGTRISPRIRSSTLKKGFAVLLAATAVRMGLNTFLLTGFT